MLKNVLALLTGAFLTFTATAATYDLRTDWTDSVNPNGAWTLRAGTFVLPHLASWTFDSFTPAQGGWADGNALPFWFKSTSTANFTHDWAANDIIVHTSDETHGATHGAPNVVWTSSFDGIINLSGNAWEGRDIGDDFTEGFRSNRWTLTLNGNLLSTGVVSGGDPYSRANPFNFSAGSGGAGVLSNIHVLPGDQIVLEIARTGVQGDYVGVNFQVTQVPEPATCAILLLGTGALATVRHRIQHRQHCR